MLGNISTCKSSLPLFLSCHSGSIRGTRLKG